MGVSADASGMSHAERSARHTSVSSFLAALSDEELGHLVDAAAAVGSGIGGTSSLLHVDGTPVFVKRMSLTDLERRPQNWQSTANLFGLPTYCHYGVASPGFGVWREVAAHSMTTDWVLDDRCGSFPVMYHWRSLRGPPAAPTPDEHADLEEAVAFWHGSAAVAERLTANATASASIALFLEYIPDNLPDWLTSQLAEGTGALGAAVSMLERELLSAVSSMNAAGLVHFDTHLGNILTDGNRIYVTDFGLATSPRFELSEAERSFMRLNLSHDVCYTVTRLVNWLVTALTGAADPAERNDLIRRYSNGHPTRISPVEAATLIERYAPIAAVMNQFYWRLHLESRATPFPAEELARACDTAGLQI